MSANEVERSTTISKMAKFALALPLPNSMNSESIDANDSAIIYFIM